jgi:hypothetical protein
MMDSETAFLAVNLNSGISFVCLKRLVSLLCVFLCFM